MHNGYLGLHKIADVKFYVNIENGKIISTAFRHNFFTISVDKGETMCITLLIVFISILKRELKIKVSSFCGCFYLIDCAGAKNMIKFSYE